ncbi:serine/threonine phosphatase [Cronbergia sp. UHCC 0137]|uniref:serine/threonine phosphatase n=1 Tax=Cronbergia sp. UHCC 0137 TaxID=3110239 RepID=UPI002B1FABEF|nr:serine/threonine phosphatase [Cronbergia sp. UHCC 0137]MEA5616565.1 serine/threonine phosphatase [Cronbergia sp. UHCC 0137]
MLICPRCKFKNSNKNKFCQNCGNSLAHKICPHCNTSVVADAVHCYNCGAESGQIWWAIISQQLSSTNSGVEKSQPLVTDFPSGLCSQLLFSKPYLDPGQRYQFLELLPKPEVVATNIEVKVRVLDRQPYQTSFLEAMLENEAKGLKIPSVSISVIPSLAKAYLKLQSENQPGIPRIHEAWEQDNIQTLLLEDRSGWQFLLDLWQQETTNSLQILHWCHQMTQLWAILEPVNCRQSLVELSNLRLDEDQTLSLQMLYLEQPAPAPPLTVKVLGQVWQNLFRQSQRTQFGPILQMLQDLEMGTIETLAQLRSRLEEISTQLAKTEPTPPQEISPSAPTILQIHDIEDSTTKNDDPPTVILSMQLTSLEDVGRTDVGRQRRHNEDCFGIETNIQKQEFPKNKTLQARGLYILCDGMGGHAGGEVASDLAVNTLRQYFQENWVTNQLPTEKSILDSIYLANQTIYDLNQQDSRSGIGRMGTTLVMVLLQDNQVAVAHVGDSRLYSLTRKRGLEQVTVDHEVGQREVSRGVEPDLAYARPDAYQLTQALGPREKHLINPSVEFFEITEDTLLLLASDGLSDNDLLETHWQNYLQPLLSSSTNLVSGMNNLIDLANEYNGHDNITAILIRLKVSPIQENFQ